MGTAQLIKICLPGSLQGKHRHAERLKWKEFQPLTLKCWSETLPPQYWCICCQIRKALRGCFHNGLICHPSQCEKTTTTNINVCSLLAPENLLSLIPLSPSPPCRCCRHYTVNRDFIYLFNTSVVAFVINRTGFPTPPLWLLFHPQPPLMADDKGDGSRDGQERNTGGLRRVFL